MCRNIKTLFNFEPPACADEIHDAALQFVRKVSGYRKPSKLNQAAFDGTVADIARSVDTLLSSLVTSQVPRDRDKELAKASQRVARRFAT